MTQIRDAGRPVDFGKKDGLARKLGAGTQDIPERAIDAKKNDMVHYRALLIDF